MRAQQARSQRQIRFDDEGIEHTNHPDAVPGTEPLNQPGDGVDLYDDESQDSPDINDETDGMGAVTFSAEEYCGFFGNDLHFISISRSLIVLKGHPRIFPSLVMYPGQSHVFPISLNRLSLLSISRTAGFKSTVVL